MVHSLYSEGGAMSSEEFLSAAEAAELLGVTRFTISRLIRSGELATYKSPLNRRKKLVRRADVEALRQPVPDKRDEDTGKAAPVAA
jgi:excisionase family DNA binding protein